MEGTHYTIKAVARRTGLSPHVIRIWEKRYGAVKPSRTPSKRRLYSDEETERLALLRRATLAGHSIGTIASLPNERLAQLGEESSLPRDVSAVQANTADAFVNEGLKFTLEMNAERLEEVLNNGIVALGQHGLLAKVVAPLAQKIGDLWQDGSLTAAHEHFATAVIRDFLASNCRPFAPAPDASGVVVATPSGQLHELGAVMVAAAARDVGWKVIYLGTSLPAAEIAGAAAQHSAAVVALSIVYPANDPEIPNELRNLRKYLGTETEILVGGRAAGAYEAALQEIGAARSAELKDVYSMLEGLKAKSTARHL